MQARHQVLVAVAAAAAASLWTPATAQNQASDAVARCRALPSESERFACMEGLVMGLSSSAAAPAPEQAAPSAAVVEPASPAIAPDPAPAPVLAPSAPATPEAGLGAREDGERRFPRLPFIGGRDEEEAVAASSEEESFGEERLRTREDEASDPEREVMVARVVSFEEVIPRRLRVELDNGQVWEQRDAVPPWRLEQYGEPDEVEIFPSRFGGYRMRLVGKNLTLGVERLR